MQYCPQCGRKLSLVDTVLARPADRLASSWLNEARDHAGAIRDSEAKASERRMGILRAQDETRIQAEREAAKTAREKERRFLAIAVLAAFLLMVLIIALGMAYFG